MRGRSLSYGRQLIDEHDIAAVAEVLRGDYLTTGPGVDRFERAVADRLGARHVVAVNSATSGLHIACLAARLAAGHEVVTSPITFLASANCARLCGSSVRLEDIDRSTLSLSAQALRRRLADKPDTAAAIVVHLAGLAADMPGLHAAADGRLMIEDAAHAFGGSYANGRPVGSGAYSDMSVFSFHPVKTITTGEGGAVATNSDELARLLRMFRSHGMERDGVRMLAMDEGHEDGSPPPWYYEQHELGLNYRMTDIQAALGLSQIAKLDKFLARRREIAARYDEAFSKLNSIDIPHSRPDERQRSGLHLYLVLIDYAALGTTRRRVMEELRSRGVGTQVHYIPLYRQPYHRGAEEPPWTRFPESESYYSRCLSLPLHPGLTDEDVGTVIDAVRDVAGG